MNRVAFTVPWSCGRRERELCFGSSTGVTLARTVLVPGPQLELGGVEVAVDEDAGSGVGAAEGGCGGEWPVTG